MTRALGALVVLALAFPAAALAQAPQTNAPPGNSAIDEYLETIPGTSGDERPGTPGGPGGSGGDSALTAAQRADLERLGPDGKTLANAVDSTSSKPGRSSKSAELPTPQSDGRSPLAEIFGAFAGSDGGNGMGILLPAILIAALLAVGLAVLLRRRATS